MRRLPSKRLHWQKACFLAPGKKRLFDGPRANFLLRFEIVEGGQALFAIGQMIVVWAIFVGGLPSEPRSRNVESRLLTVLSSRHACERFSCTNNLLGVGCLLTKKPSGLQI